MLWSVVESALSFLSPPSLPLSPLARPAGIHTHERGPLLASLRTAASSLLAMADGVGSSLDVRKAALARSAREGTTTVKEHATKNAAAEVSPDALALAAAKGDLAEIDRLVSIGVDVNGATEVRGRRTRAPGAGQSHTLMCV